MESIIWSKAECGVNVSHMHLLLFPTINAPSNTGIVTNKLDRHLYDAAKFIFIRNVCKMYMHYVLLSCTVVSYVEL